MSTAPQLFVSGIPDPALQQLARAMSGDLRIGKVRSLKHDFNTIVAHANDGSPVPLLLSLDQDAQDHLPLITALSRHGVPVVAAARGRNAELILQVFRAGAAEFAVLDDVADLRACMTRVLNRGAHNRTGQITTIFPAKGGVGATSIATHLAGALKHSGAERVCLIDLDRYFGDVLAFLDVPATYSLTTLMQNMGRLDMQLLDASVPQHSSGVFVLAHSDNVDDAEALRAEEMPRLLSFLRSHYDHIVIDGVRGFDDVTLAVLDASDRVMVTLLQDVPSVRNAQRCLDIFSRLDYAENKVQLLLNRYQRKLRISKAVIAEATGYELSGELGNDFALLAKAISSGAMLSDLARRARLSRDVMRLAHGMMGNKPAANQAPRWLPNASQAELANGTF